MFENRIDFRSYPVVTVNHTADLSGSAGKDDFSLTSLECLLMLEAYRKGGLSNTSRPEIHGVDTENITECLHNLKGMGLLEDQDIYGAGNENIYSLLTARGEEAIGQIRATWKVLMGQSSVSVADIRAAINILSQLDSKGAYTAAHHFPQDN